MHVKIGKYKNWIGPYQIAEALCFWVPEVEGDYGIKSKPDWVHDFGTWLSGGKGKESLLLKVCQWIESHRHRQVYVRIDYWDTWSMDHNLAYIILPMLKQLHGKKHGAPFVDDEDVPEYLRSTSAPAKENDYDTDANHFLRWDWALLEMIQAFECKLDDTWQDQYRSGEHEIVWTPSEELGKNGKPRTYQMDRGPNDTYKCDYTALKAHEQRNQNGFRLFGKYYQNLWD